MFRAILLDQIDGKVEATLQEVEAARLPAFEGAGGVTVAVEYTTLNYKDGMILNGIGRLVRNYPHVPGIDFAGVVTASAHPDYKPGDKVILTGWRVGEVTWGGYAERARVKGDWLVPLPEGLTSKRAMALGTAGFTAMLAVMALEDHGVTPDRGEILVTGAAGGVGSVATALLARLGYQVTASTGRAETHDYLTSLGAQTLIDRAELSEPRKRPLESQRWAGCIDNVGGTTLARVLAQTKLHGSVAAVGNASGSALETTVLPFLLRGINLLGIDSGTCPVPRRRQAWARLASELPMDQLDAMTSEAVLGELPGLARKILKGQVRGRLVVDVNR